VTVHGNTCWLAGKNQDISKKDFWTFWNREDFVFVAGFVSQHLARSGLCHRCMVKESWPMKSFGSIHQTQGSSAPGRQPSLVAVLL